MDFIFQTDFSDFTLKVLGRRFKLVEGDSIQMVIWMGHIHNLPVRDRYFVFTKQGLYWNFPAIVQSGEEGQTAERTICDSDFFQKQDSSFSLVFTKCEEELNELHLKMGERTFVFQFTKNFPKERLEELESIIRDYFTGYFDEKKYEEKAKKSKLRLSFYNIPDFFKQVGFVIAGGYLKFIEKTEVFFENLGKKKSNPKAEKSEKTENINAKEAVKSTVPLQSENRFVRFIRHTFDLTADLIFVLAVVILIKPEINAIVFEKCDFPTNLLLSRLVKLVTVNGIPLLNENFLGCLFLFVVFKMVVILSCKNIRKIVPLLLLVILSISTVLIKISFLIFLILSLLLLLTLQFSMNFKSKTIKTKVGLFIILTLALYISLHLLLSLPEINNINTGASYIDVFYLFLKDLGF